MYKSFWQLTASGRVIIFLLKGKKFQENGSSPLGNKQEMLPCLMLAFRNDA